MLSVITLNYFNPELTAKSVHKLFNAADVSGIELEVIVVDNSAPETAQKLRSTLPDETIIIENKENTGAAKGYNQGMNRAKGDILLYMNNDLFINAEVLRGGLDYMQSNKDTAIWAPKLTDEEGRSQRSCSYLPSLTGVISEYIFNYPWGNRIALNALKSQEPLKVENVIAACLFIRKNILKEVGGFDEDYFFNVEDVDLCYKLYQRGDDVIFDPRVEAIHLCGASQNSNWYDDPYLHKYRKLYFKKNHNLFKAGAARFFISFGIALRKFKHTFD